MAEEKTGRDPFNSRYKESKTDESAEAAETSKTEKMSETESSSKTERTPVRERDNINMYIEDDGLVEEFRLRYAELNVLWRAEHGEDMPKNDIWYPAVLRAVLEGKDIKEVLDI